MKQQYFTTPIYYVNGSPHIGHCYTGILTDVLARIAAMKGNEVRMQTGTDEHGNKVEQAAKANGFDNTMAFCTEISAKFKNLMLATNLCCTYNKFDAAENFYRFKAYDNDFAGGENFIRTTEGRNEKGEITKESFIKGRHIKSVQELWKKLDENGWFYKDYYKGWYAVRDEAFYDESEIINGKAPTGAPVEWREEEAYFFKLSNFQDILINFYENNGSLHLPDFAKHEIIDFMKGGLRDLCVSRQSVKWGIPVPSDSLQCNDSSHSIYVWLDALQNYISALDNEKQKWWNDVDKKTHVIGKDILRFHTIYWSAFLIAEKFTKDDIEERISQWTAWKIAPKEDDTTYHFCLTDDMADCFPYFFVHGWWLNNGQKMSKSLNNSLDPYLEIDFIKQQIETKIARPQDLDALALDYFRYFLIKAVPTYGDGNYLRNGNTQIGTNGLIQVVNADLVNNIGNLAKRVLDLVYKNFSEMPNIDYDTLDYSQTAFKLNQFDSNIIEDCIWFISVTLFASSNANKQIDDKKPWEMIKNNKIKEFCDFMFVQLVNIYQIALLIRPIVPFISESILNYMNIPFRHRNFLPKNYAEIVFNAMKGGFKQPPYPIVPRLREI